MTEDERKLSVAEVRKTIASSLGTAFGFVIGLVWSQVVLGGFTVAGVSLTTQSAIGNWGGWGIFMVTALVVSVFMILLIILISRWGSKGIKGVKGQPGS